MKILHFIYDHIGNPWVGGGGAVRCFEIYRRLAKKGHEITVISGNYPGAEDNETEGVKFKFLGSKRHYIISVFSYAFEAMKFLSKYASHYDIIVEDFAPWNPIFSFKYQSKKPLILQIHQKEGLNILRRYNALGLPFYLMERYYPKKFKNVLTVSETSKKRFGISNAEVIPNGINENLFDKDDSQYLTQNQYCLFLGRINFYHKGLDILIKAFENLKIPLIIAGSGKDEKRLIKIIENKTHIKFIGRIAGEDKIKTIKSAKFMIIPSRYEGQPLVILESAAIGTPVITSDIEELKYAVENKFGLSFKSEDWQDLKEKVEFLWNNNKLLEQFSKNGRLYARQFTWDAIAKQYEKYLSKACIQSMRI